MVCQVNSSWCQFKKILEILTKSLQNRQKSFILLLEMLPDHIVHGNQDRNRKEASELLLI